MNKFTIGFSILSTLLIGAGCTDEASIVDETPTGNAVFALTNGDFALQGTLTIDPVAAGDNIVETITDDSEPTVAVELAPGAYNATLTNWTLFEFLGPTRTSAAPEDVISVTVTPAPFTIVDDVNTAVSINFLLSDAEPVVFEPAVDQFALVTLSVTDDPDGCVETCAVGETCVSINDGAGTCEITCDNPGVDEETCGPGGNCVEGEELNICNFVID